MLTGFLSNESSSKKFANLFAESLLEAIDEGLLAKGLIVFLRGDLGTGKTFFCRALIQTFLPEQKVKSPTYSIVESYQLLLGEIQHFDLYRVVQAEELELLGIRNLLAESFCSLIEWPENGLGVLPAKADIEIEFNYQEEARKFVVNSFSDKGLAVIKGLTKKIA